MDDNAAPYLFAVSLEDRVYVDPLDDDGRMTGTTNEQVERVEQLVDNEDGYFVYALTPLQEHVAHAVHDHQDAKLLLKHGRLVATYRFPGADRRIRTTREHVDDALQELSRLRSELYRHSEQSEDVRFFLDRAQAAVIRALAQLDPGFAAGMAADEEAMDWACASDRLDQRH